ncbi:MAG: hypothetical protein ACWGOD_03780 [Desulfobulbales bacterium]
MVSKPKMKETIRSISNVPIDFDLCSSLEDSPEGKKVINKYFLGVWDIFKLNDICNSYLLRKKKDVSKPITDNVRECLNKIADVFTILQETTYPLYLLKMNLTKVALDTDGDGPLARNLRDAANWFNSKIYEIENSQLDNDTLKVCANVAREATEEISKKTKRGDTTSSFAERRLIVDIAELYQNIHGEWPLRDSKLPDSAGPLDEIMTVLEVLLDCSALTKLISDFDTDLRERLEKEQNSKKKRETRTGFKRLITS